MCQEGCSATDSLIYSYKVFFTNDPVLTSNSLWYQVDDNTDFILGKFIKKIFKILLMF
jgi:hypothetical protein